jgi:broad specificity phosphatase PhoE
VKIVVLRHGRVVLPAPRSVVPAQLAAWIAAYDQAKLDPTLPPPASTVEIALTCRLVVCSSLTRSQASALALGKAPDVTDELFDEFRLAYAPWRGPALLAQLWLVFFRLLALFGDHEHDQTRARRAAAQLVRFARDGGPVLFIGHGLINRAIARELRAAGWRGPARPSTRHWAFSVYEA